VVDGKGNVLKALTNLQASRTKGVLAIVDGDSDHLDNSLSGNPDVITTETRDIEGLLLKSPGFEKVLNEHGITVQGSQIPRREDVLLAARTLGYIRWLAFRSGWSLDFKYLNFKSFIDAYGIKCDDSKLAAEIMNKNPGFAVAGTAIVTDALRLASPQHDPWQVANGHDMAKILAIVIATRRGQNITSKEIESNLRLAFANEHMMATKLFIAICNWQKTNKPFIVLIIPCP
jgi:hypothetical protein